MIKGIAGVMMGLISQKKINNMKALDLRLELKKSEADYYSKISKIKKLLEEANKSRQSVASATGKLKSGMMKEWKKDFALDKESLASLSDTFPYKKQNYDRLVPNELESKLIEIHKLQNNLRQLEDKYIATIQSDDTERNHIRENTRVR